MLVTCSMFEIMNDGRSYVVDLSLCIATYSSIKMNVMSFVQLTLYYVVRVTSKSLSEKLKPSFIIT